VKGTGPPELLARLDAMAAALSEAREAESLAVERVDTLLVEVKAQAAKIKALAHELATMENQWAKDIIKREKRRNANVQDAVDSARRVIISLREELEELKRSHAGEIMRLRREALWLAREEAFNAAKETT
jgi:hypothetical protein